MPREPSLRPCVRARFDAVETPLKRMKKSRNALKKPLFPLFAIGEEPHAPTQPIGSNKVAHSCRIPADAVGLFPDKGGFVFVLADAADGKDLAVHHDEDAGREQARGKQAFGEVLQGVAALKAQGRHGPGQNNRHF